jgi:hypothetical protein
MNVYLILEETHQIPEPVKASILSQAGVGKVVIVECRSPGDPTPGAGHTPARKASELFNRLDARDKAKASGDEFCVIQDRAYKHKPGNFQLGVEYLTQNPSCAAVSLVPHAPEEINHIDVGCCVWRISALSKLTLEGWAGHHICACNAIRKKMESEGFSIVYLPGSFGATKISA